MWKESERGTSMSSTVLHRLTDTVTNTATILDRESSIYTLTSEDQPCSQIKTQLIPLTTVSKLQYFVTIFVKSSNGNCEIKLIINSREAIAASIRVVSGILPAMFFNSSSPLMILTT